MIINFGEINQIINYSVLLFVTILRNKLGHINL